MHLSCMKKPQMILGLYKTIYNKSPEYRIILFNDYDKAIIFCVKPHTFPADVAFIALENVSDIYSEILT